MNLSFSVLVVDDQPDAIAQAVESLREHLDEWGFALSTQEVVPSSRDELRSQVVDAGREYDLVIVDYRLGLDGRDGAVVAQELRHGILPYTEMVFYSSDSSANLLRTLAEKEVEGVFVATRDHLDEKLRGVADIIIRKAIDLDHMRGIAMAAVADLEMMMKGALGKASACSCARCVAAVKRTIRRVGERHAERVEEYRELAPKGLSFVLDEVGMCDAEQKARGIVRVIKQRSEPELRFDSEAIGTLTADHTDILKKRNSLAHSPASLLGDLGTEDGMREFRRRLRQHTRSVVTICDAIEGHVASVVEGAQTPNGES